MTFTDRFMKPDSPVELVLLLEREPRQGVPLTCKAARYPEVTVRVMARLREPDAAFCDDAAMVAQSTALFWEEGTPAQVLLTATLASGARWTLSLTRWGCLRWEYVPPDDTSPIASLQCRHPLTTQVAPQVPFYTGLTIAGSDCPRVRLIVGQEPGPAMNVVAQIRCDELPGWEPGPKSVSPGCGPDGWRPWRGALDEVLVASTSAFELFGPESDPPLDSSFSGGSGMAVGYVGRDALSVLPGPTFESASGNHWHFLRVTDSAVRRLVLEKTGSMSPRCFASYDRSDWFAPRQRLIPGGRRRLEVFLPQRDRPIYVANCPVFGLPERDNAIRRATGMGAQVRVIGRSQANLPLHAVKLTDRAVALDGKVGVVMLCGQHSPVEQMTGWLGATMVEELHRLDGGERAGLLQRLAFYWLPILNIDCAHFGTNGATLDGKNPNRQWFSGQGPEQRAVEGYFITERQDGLRLGLMIDGHAGGGWRNHTVLADYHQPQEQAADPSLRRGADLLKPDWFALLDRVCGLREVWENGYIEGAGMQRAPEWFQSTFGCPAFTLECGVVSHLDPTDRRTKVFDLDSFKELGRNLALALAEGEDLLRRGCSRNPDAAAH